ncbi:MAG: metallophosphoesterase [Ruminococcaceae bacterium]|nr:metallophosphoesterase [Oscillospiraceae bacterium]
MKRFLSILVAIFFLITMVVSAEEKEVPLFTIACFSDLHIDYGIQFWDTPIRKTTIEAVDFVRDELGGADLVMVGGDITSQNDKNATWTNDAINKVRDCVHNTVSQASKDGKVLYVTGNHDSQASVAAGGSFWSGDYEKYMKGELGTYDAAFYREGSKYEELLCYRYNIRGLEFIGINTPSIADGSSVTYLSQIEWVADELSKIGKDKTVIILCHYPVSSLTDPTAGKDATVSRMREVLEEYPNIIYCYGHVHGSDERYAWRETSELVEVRKSGGITCHMGSMAYYMNQFHDDWLTVDEPQIVQLMMISFYEDHIEFQMYNTGEKSAVEGVYQLKPFTVERNMDDQITSGAPFVPVTIIAAVVVAGVAVVVALKSRDKKENS